MFVVFTIFSNLLPPKIVITFISKSRRVRVLYGALRGVCSHCCIDYPFVVSPNRAYSRQTVFLLGSSLFLPNLFEKTVQCKSTSRMKERRCYCSRAYFMFSSGAQLRGLIMSQRPAMFWSRSVTFSAAGGTLPATRHLWEWGGLRLP